MSLAIVFAETTSGAPSPRAVAAGPLPSRTEFRALLAW
jgi:hypothetical protein